MGHQVKSSTNAPDSHRRSLSVRFNASKDLLRTETLKGDEYLVTPAVILVEGVLSPGNGGGRSELAVGEEFGKIPASWDGRPVTISHPKVDGQFVNAGRYDVWDSGVVVGMLFNTSYNGGKLRTEIWVNKTWMEEAGYQNTLQRLAKGETMEVSTGLFADTSDESGIWNGERYDGIWYNIVPDHLALLPHEIGACSVEDGCGTARVNQSQERITAIRTMAAEMRTSTPNTKGCCMPKETNDKMGILSRLISFFSSFSSNGTENVLMANTTDMNDNDIRSALNSALQAKGEKYYHLVAVYDDRMVYETYSPEDYSYHLYSRGYSIGDDGVISLSDDMIEVRPVTDFVPVSVSTDALPETVTVTDPGSSLSAPPTIPEKVSVSASEDTTNTNTSVTDSPKETSAETSAETQGIGAVEVEVNTKEENSAKSEETVQKENTANILDNLEGVLSLSSDSLAAELKEAVALRTQARKDLCVRILRAKTNTFSVQELQDMSTEQLQKIDLMASNHVDYSGMGGPSVQSRETDTNVVSPVLVFPRKAL